MSLQIPQTMKALHLNAQNQLSYVTVPTPVPKYGEVLIKVFASPLNPSDLMFMQGLYPFQKPRPCTPGFEAAGLVVQNGGGIMGWNLLGQRVACTTSQNPQEQSGPYGEYMITQATSCFKLHKDVSYEQGCMTIVNPLSVYSMLEVAQAKKATAVVQTAAASQLGRMLQKYFTQNKIKVINVVRRQEQVEILKNDGAQYVLNSSDTNFDEQLQKLAADLNANVCFEAIGGQMTNNVLQNMPNGSTVYVYGCLSLENCQVSAMDLIFKQKKVEGFWLNDHLKNKSIIGLVLMANYVGNAMLTTFKSNISKEFDLSEYENAISSYKKNMTAGKILFRPNKE